jgi:magnesium-transporting ATPase (P-type)
VLVLLTAIGRCYDLLTAYLYIPDLNGETNVLVKYLGFRWTSSIVFQCSIFLITVFCLYYYFFKFERKLPIKKNLTFKAFVSQLYFGTDSSFGKVFFSLPKDNGLFIASFGYIVAMTLITVSFIVGTSTVLLIVSLDYRNFYSHGMVQFIYVLIALVGFYFAFRFYRLEYLRYRRRADINDRIKG